MVADARTEFAGVAQQRTTSWHNPTKEVQRAVLFRDLKAMHPDRFGRDKFVFEVAPGGTVELDSQYDRALQLIDCGHNECHQKGGYFCVAGHEGTVVGGMLPRLRRVGKNDRMEDYLDPDAAARKEVERQVDQDIRRAELLSEYQGRVAKAAPPPQAPAQAAKK